MRLQPAILVVCNDIHLYMNRNRLPNLGKLCFMIGDHALQLSNTFTHSCIEKPVMLQANNRLLQQHPIRTLDIGKIDEIVDVGGLCVRGVVFRLGVRC